MSELLTKIKKDIIKTTKFSLTPFKIILLGLLIRILLIPFSLVYDSNYWTLVVRSISSGHGLYEMDVYYYTPVWGYILGFVSGIQNFILNMGDVSSLIPELMPCIGMGNFYRPIAVNIIFLLELKVILTISDLILSILVYDLVKEKTNDEKKSTIAFLFVFLCPVILLSSSIIVMPDTISAMFTMMTIFAIRKKKMFSAGVFYSIAVWIKFFPISIALLLISYIFILNKDNIKGAVLKLITALGGFFICSLVIFMPQIQNGELIRCFHFLYGRINFLSYLSITQIILLIGMMTIICIVFYVVGKRMYRSPKPVDDMLMEYSLVVVGLCMIFYLNTQYVVHMIPFLVYCMSVVDRRKYRIIWIGLSISGLCLTMAASNAIMLNSLVEYTGLISIDTVLSLSNFLNCDETLGISITEGINHVFNPILKFFVVLIPLLFFMNVCYKYLKKNMSESTCVNPGR